MTKRTPRVPADSEKQVFRKTEVLNIRLPDELILELDAFVEKKVFKSRSEAVREFAREYVQEQVQTQKAKSGRGGEGW